MGQVQVPDEIQRLIERQVEEGRAASVAEVLEAAVLRFLDAAAAAEAELLQAAEAGLEDAAAGRMTVIGTPEEAEALRAQVLGRLRADLSP